jgi:hypothetical protein
MEIRNPGLDTRVRIDIPPEQADQPEDSTIFARENIIKLCTAALGSVPDWYYLIQRQIEEGRSLELAWRLDTQLDWVWQDECVDGTRRYWAVLCGLPLKQVSLRISFTSGVGPMFPPSEMHGTVSRGPTSATLSDELIHARWHPSCGTTRH